MMTLTHLILKFDLLQLIRQWLEGVEVHNSKLAKFLCKLIPASCPFERDIKFFDRILFHIPALCKLNPFYEQLMNIRFRSLSYLADKCGEDLIISC
ncbi:nitrogenase [Cyanosarcina cf. burmensis CCALA 770]|nr:nitrogenase [Cyanosarcina cf. burmensis CCALA 770]